MKFWISMLPYSLAVATASSHMVTGLDGFGIWSLMFTALSMMVLHNYPRGGK